MTWHIKHGTGYLLCFDVPFGHARHYLGITDRLSHRLEEHERGKGAKLTSIVRKAGISWALTRTWDDCDRNRERQLKQSRGTRHCPRCRKETVMGKDAAYRELMATARAHFTEAIAAANAEREIAGTRQWNKAVKAAQQELRTARDLAAEAWKIRQGEVMTEQAFRLTDGLAPHQAAELIGRLEAGYRRAYEASHDVPYLSDEYWARLQTAAELNGHALIGMDETTEAGRQPGESLADWVARAERELFEEAATAAKDLQLADERAADAEAHERALDEEIERLAAEYPEVSDAEREQAEIDAEAPYEGPGSTEPPVSWEGWHRDHTGWTFEAWAVDHGYSPKDIAAVNGEPDPDPTPPAAAAREAAGQMIVAQADAGMSADQIDRNQADTAADMLSDAQTPDGKAFAREYDDTAATLVRDLRELDRPEEIPPGTPHPNPYLADRGWQTCEHGHASPVYVRRDPEPQQEMEAA